MENDVRIEELPDTFTKLSLKTNCASQINYCVAPHLHLPQTSSLEWWLKATRTCSTKIQTFKKILKVLDGTSRLVRRQLSKKPAYGAVEGAEQREAKEASFIKLWIN